MRDLEHIEDIATGYHPSRLYVSFSCNNNDVKQINECKYWIQTLYLDVAKFVDNAGKIVWHH